MSGRGLGIGRRDQERKPAPARGSEQRSRALKLCAGALAVVSTSAVAVPVFAGFGLRSWLFPLVLVVFFVVFLPANLLAEKFVRANRWSGGLPAWRLALAVLVGVVVAYAGLLWSYSARIQAVSEPVPAAERAAETRRLEAERADLRGVAARVPVPVAEDPEVRRFRAELAEARRQADEARRRELCELDGTCGTGDDGIGEAYRERKEYRQELDRRVAELTRGHDAAVRAAEQRARDVEAEADRARTRIDEIDDRLADLALSDPRGRSLFDAVITLQQDGDGRVPLLLFGFWLSFVGLDHGLMRLAVFWVCAPEAKRPRLVDGIAARAEADQQAVARLRYEESKSGREGAP